MELRLDGKVALVTGGSKGIGLGVAAALVESGARVMIVSRRTENLARARDSLGGQVECFAANAGDYAAAGACVDATLERLGSLEILVNNAATNPHLGPLTEIGESAAAKIAQVNQWSVLAWTQHAWRARFADHGGVILNVASIGGFAVEPGIGYYNVSKAAVIHLTRQLAVELAPRVRVNALAPGLVKTDFARALWERDEEVIASRLPCRRLGDPADVAAAAVFLASDAASWITGHTLVVDGGALAVAGTVT